MNLIKDVRAKIDRSFFKLLLQSDYELLESETQTKLGVTDFVSEIKRAEICPDFEKLAHVIQHGLQGFRIKWPLRQKIIFCRSGSVAQVLKL